MSSFIAFRSLGETSNCPELYDVCFYTGEPMTSHIPGNIKLSQVTSDIGELAQDGFRARIVPGQKTLLGRKRSILQHFPAEWQGDDFMYASIKITDEGWLQGLRQCMGLRPASRAYCIAAKRPPPAPPTPASPPSENPNGNPEIPRAPDSLIRQAPFANGPQNTNNPDPPAAVTFAPPRTENQTVTAEQSMPVQSFRGLERRHAECFDDWPSEVFASSEDEAPASTRVSPYSASIPVEVMRASSSSLGGDVPCRPVDVSDDDTLVTDQQDGHYSSDGQRYITNSPRSAYTVDIYVSGSSSDSSNGGGNV